MVTTDIFEKLKDLQDILVNKYDLEAKINDAPKNLGSQEELLSRLKKEYITKDEDYKAIKEKIGQLKLELDEAVKSREDGAKGMDNIQTHREYEALDKQINEATIKENDVRKDLQQEEKKLEALNESIKSYEEMIKAQENDLNSAKESIDGEIASYQKELNKLQKKEDSITPSLDPEILFKFQRIIQRNSEGIVAVKNGVCTGCHMILPAQFANTVREAENILFCPYCSRILFYEEGSDDSDENYYNLDDAGSLADLDDGFDDEYDADEVEEREEDLYDKANEFAGESGDFDEDESDDDDEDSDENENEEDNE